MTTINISDEKMLILETSFMNLTTRCIDDGFSPYACAAIMTKLAFMIYKTSMNAEDYNAMINSISDSRDRIKSFDELQQKSRLN